MSMRFTIPPVGSTRFARGLFVAVAILALSSAAHAQPASPQVEALSLEDLLDLEVVSTASKFPQSVREAPASITVIDAEEIRRFGYRTLADVLRSIRGFYTSYDRNYDYVGTRGFSRPGDYNTRLLLLVDGQRLNDGIYDMAAIGTDGSVPISLIKRIEVIRGPGSSLYGSNALFGVINVVTKTGGELKGVHVEARGGSLASGGAGVSYGRLFGNGTEVLLAANGYRSSGQSELHFAEFDGADGTAAIASHLDDDEVSTFLGSVSAGRFSVRATGVRRYKQVPTAPFAVVFGDPRMFTIDSRATVTGVYDGPLGRSWMATARIGYDYYSYHGDYPFDYGDDGIQVFEDRSLTHALTGEVTARRRLGRAHQVTIGAEMRHQMKAQQVARELSQEVINLDMPGTTVGAYIQDEIRAASWLLVNIGARVDRLDDFGARATPRAAVVLLPRTRSAVKLLYGQAFRAPNTYERYYYNYDLGLSDQLRPEQIRSTEIVWEETLSPHVRTTVSGFMYDVDRLIEQRAFDISGENLYFANTAGATRAHGIEAEIQGRFDNGVSAQFSHAFTRVRDRETSGAISNSPANLSKASVLFPVPGALAIAISGQYVGERLTLRGEQAKGFFVSNLSVTNRDDRRLNVGVSVYNLFNRTYAHPGAEEHRQASIRQDGRTLLVRAGIRF